MKSIRPEDSNLTLAPPADWNAERDGPCETLYGVRSVDDFKNVINQTLWEPTEEELAALNAGARIVLTIWGVPHPPVAIDVSQPAPRSS